MRECGRDSLSSVFQHISEGDFPRSEDNGRKTRDGEVRALMDRCVLNRRAPSGHCVQVISDSSLRGSFPPQTAAHIGSLGRNADAFSENTLSDVSLPHSVFGGFFFDGREVHQTGSSK